MTTRKKQTETGSRRGTYSYAMLMAEWALPYTNDKWMKDAACKGQDQKHFFPDRGANGGHHKAKQVCAGCSVRVDCLRYALKNNISYGVWGGLPPASRSRNKKKLLEEIGDDDVS